MAPEVERGLFRSLTRGSSKPGLISPSELTQLPFVLPGNGATSQLLSSGDAQGLTREDHPRRKKSRMPEAAAAQVPGLLEIDQPGEGLSHLSKGPGAHSCRAITTVRTANACARRCSRRRNWSPNWMSCATTCRPTSTRRCCSNCSPAQRPPSTSGCPIVFAVPGFLACPCRRN